MIVKVSLPSHWGSELSLSNFLDQDGALSGTRFLVGPDVRAADAWVVFDEVEPHDMECLVSRDRVIFVTAESAWPEDFWLRPGATEFLSQFARVFSSHVSNHPGYAPSAPFLPWMVHANHGKVWSPHSQNLESLRETEIPEKKHRLSVIVSSKASTPGHRIRLDFVRRLKRDFGDSLTWFGNGVRPIAQKWDGLASFDGTIAIENSIRSDVVTEKILDPFLAYTVPLYAGAPNVGEYFTVAEKWKLDLRDYRESVSKVEDFLTNGPQASDFELLKLNRERVLGEMHFLNRIQNLLKTLQVRSPVERISLRPFSNPNRFQVASRMWSATRKKVGL